MSQPQPDNQEIHQLLIQLHDELERTHTVDENERAIMRHLMDDIQAILNRPGLNTAQDTARENALESDTRDRLSSAEASTSGLIGRLEESVSQLEVSHPTLAAVIEKAIETLNIAGI